MLRDGSHLPRQVVLQPVHLLPQVLRLLPRRLEALDLGAQAGRRASDDRTISKWKKEQ
jgi:hypothetical protein